MMAWQSSSQATSFGQGCQTRLVEIGKSAELWSLSIPPHSDLMIQFPLSL